MFGCVLHCLVACLLVYVVMFLCDCLFVCAFDGVVVCSGMCALVCEVQSVLVCISACAIVYLCLCCLLVWLYGCVLV